MRRFSISKIHFRQYAALMASYIDDWGEDDVVMASVAKGNYNEMEPMNWWLAMCMSAGSRNTIMDVGAYTGLYALMASAIRPDLKTVAFEASAMTYGRLSYNILLNQAEMKIIPAHYAISDETGSLDLRHAYGIFTMASGESIHANYQTDHKETVPGAALDRLLCLNGEPHVGTLASVACGISFDTNVHAMKIDTEGAEEQVLLGAQAMLAKDKPHMIIEIFESDVLSRITSLLASIGYAIVAQCDGCNYVFSHADKSEQLVKHHRRITNQGEGAYRLERLVELNVAALQ